MSAVIVGAVIVWWISEGRVGRRAIRALVKLTFLCPLTANLVSIIAVCIANSKFLACMRWSLSSSVCVILKIFKWKGKKQQHLMSDQKVYGQALWRRADFFAAARCTTLYHNFLSWAHFCTCTFSISNSSTSDFAFKRGQIFYTCLCRYKTLASCRKKLEMRTLPSVLRNIPSVGTGVTWLVPTMLVKRIHERGMYLHTSKVYRSPW